MKHLPFSTPRLWLGGAALAVAFIQILFTLAPGLFLRWERQGAGWLILGLGLCAVLAFAAALYCAGRFVGRAKPARGALAGLLAFCGWLAAYGLFFAALLAVPGLLLGLDPGGWMGALAAAVFFPLPLLTAYACVSPAGFWQSVWALLKHWYLVFFFAAWLELAGGAWAAGLPGPWALAVTFLLSVVLRLGCFALALKTLTGLRPRWHENSPSAIETEKRLETV